MTAAINGQHVTAEPWFRETKLTSLGGVTFQSFAKYSKFDKGKNIFSLTLYLRRVEVLSYPGF